MTSGQRDVLAALTDGPKTTRQLAASSTIGTTRGRLRRSEDAGLVRRVYLVAPRANVAHWELTHAGRSALQLTG